MLSCFFPPVSLTARHGSRSWSSFTLKQRNIRTTTSVSNPNDCAQNRTTQSSKKEKNKIKLSNAAASTNLSQHQNPQQISPIPWRKTTVGLWAPYVFTCLLFSGHIAIVHVVLLSTCTWHILFIFRDQTQTRSDDSHFSENHLGSYVFTCLLFSGHIAIVHVVLLSTCTWHILFIFRDQTQTRSDDSHFSENHLGLPTHPNQIKYKKLGTFWNHQNAQLWGKGRSDDAKPAKLGLLQPMFFSNICEGGGLAIMPEMT